MDMKTSHGLVQAPHGESLPATRADKIIIVFKDGEVQVKEMPADVLIRVFTYISKDEPHGFVKDFALCGDQIKNIFTKQIEAGGQLIRVLGRY